MPFYTVLDRFPGVRVALWRLAEDSETLCGFFPEKSKGVCEKAVGGITAEKRPCPHIPPGGAPKRILQSAAVGSIQ